ncbi:MAG: ATP-binding protein, partial [Candidatus Diapherotrites archaeon]|nr:ATP-binding protein [Candidatus Diapherotrites archaeon]
SINQTKTDSLKNVLTEIGRKYVLVFDEFQDIQEKNKNLVNQIRSIVQFLKKTSVMLGSKRHLLHGMFLNPRGIFYNFGYALHLEKIPEEKFRKFILNGFRKNGVPLEPAEANQILTITENHPFFTQYLCHFLFRKRMNEKASVEMVLGEILEMNQAFYDETYRSLPTGQRKALRLLAQGKKEIYGSEILRKFGVTSAQALQKALKALIKKEIVDQNGTYFIIDSFFRHWLNRPEH